MSTPDPSALTVRWCLAAKRGEGRADRLGPSRFPRGQQCGAFIPPVGVRIAYTDGAVVKRLGAEGIRLRDLVPPRKGGA
ncbi:MAG TPA: hypothetical protein VLM91_01910 [Candidatus Methylomirabilis sp.]|nr:hypothetical protein [Candidatus Methylomirabilis sp.]